MHIRFTETVKKQAILYHLPSISILISYCVIFSDYCSSLIPRPLLKHGSSLGMSVMKIVNDLLHEY